mgnify:CR=1 FL=1
MVTPPCKKMQPMRAVVVSQWRETEYEQQKEGGGDRTLPVWYKLPLHILTMNCSVECLKVK